MAAGGGGDRHRPASQAGHGSRTAFAQGYGAQGRSPSSGQGMGRAGTKTGQQAEVHAQTVVAWEADLRRHAALSARVTRDQSAAEVHAQAANGER